MVKMPELFRRLAAVVTVVIAVVKLKLPPPPDSPRPASQAQKPMVIHLARSNGLNNICFTRSRAGETGSTTLISRGRLEVGG